MPTGASTASPWARAGVFARCALRGPEPSSAAVSEVCGAVHDLSAAQRHPRQTLRIAYRIAVIEVVGKRLRIECDQIGELPGRNRAAIGNVEDACRQTRHLVKRRFER